MTSPSKRIRVTLPELEYARLSWLAGQAGLDAPTEAAKLLIAGIRRAADGWRKLLDAPTASVDELDALLRRTFEDEPDQSPGDRTRDIEHSPGPTHELESVVRPLPASFWEQDVLPDMPPEVR